MRKETFHRLSVITILMMIAMVASAMRQDLSGKVVDENGAPLQFANVVLLSLPDSAFVQGAVTDEDGMFNIVTDKRNRRRECNTSLKFGGFRYYM